MNDSSAQQLFQQVHKYLVAFLLLLIIIGLSAFSAVYFPTINHDKTITEQLAKVASQTQYQTAFVDVRQQVEKILAINNAQQFIGAHEKLIKKWQTLLVVKYDAAKKLSLWLGENHKNNGLVSRISDASRRNNQIKQQAIEQLMLLNGILEKNIADDNNKYYAQLLKENLSTIILGLTHLNINSSSASFEQLAEHINRAFILTASGVIQDDNFNFQVEYLKELLITEQRMLAKWRGYLRLIVQYRESLTKQLQQLSYPLLFQEETPATLINQISQRVDYANEPILFKLERILILSKKQSYFIGIIIFSSLLFLYLSFLLSQRLKRHGEITIALVDGLVYGQAYNETAVDSIENLYLQQQLVKVTKPKYSDENYQSMMEQYQAQLAVLSDVNGVAYWRFSQKHPVLSKAITDLFDLSTGVESPDSATKHSWRSYFTLNAIKSIIKSARKAKKEGEPQSLYAETYNNENVLLHIIYQHGQWFGTVADAKRNDQLQQKITELDTELIRQNKSFYQQDNLKKHKLNEMLIQAMLQSQSRSCHGETSIQEYRQLAKILEWLRQQQIITRLQANGKAINLTPINIVDETYAAVLNAMCEAGQFKNEISLKLDQNILPNIKQDARLFQRLILVTLRVLFNQQINASGSLSISLLNRSSNQQTLKVVVQLLPITPDKNASLLMGHLLKHGTKVVEDTPDLIHYFQVLLSSLHGSNLRIVKQTQGVELSYELPVETLAKQPTKLVASCLTQNDVLFHGDDKNQTTFITNIFNKPENTQLPHYSLTNVELLLAVQQPKKQLALLGVLHWFGLQVRVVSSAQAMKKHWQTGRYLILINEFEQSPFIELTLGRSIQRGVFNFANLNNGILSHSQQKLSQNWKLGNLPKTLELSVLTQLLSPWLKEKKTGIDKNISGKISEKSLELTQKNKKSNISTQALKADGELPPAFDMSQYMLHQGGVELAVYMLDDYLQSNHDYLAKLRKAVTTKNVTAAHQSLIYLENNAKILAAQKLITLCELLNNALDKKDFMQMQQLLNDFTAQLLLVDAYVKTI